MKKQLILITLFVSACSSIPAQRADLAASEDFCSSSYEFHLATPTKPPSGTFHGDREFFLKYKKRTIEDLAYNTLIPLLANYKYNYQDRGILKGHSFSVDRNSLPYWPVTRAYWSQHIGNIDTQLYQPPKTLKYSLKSSWMKDNDKYYAIICFENECKGLEHPANNWESSEDDYENLDHLAKGHSSKNTSAKGIVYRGFALGDLYERNYFIPSSEEELCLSGGLPKDCYKQDLFSKSCCEESRSAASFGGVSAQSCSEVPTDRFSCAIKNRLTGKHRAAASMTERELKRYSDLTFVLALKAGIKVEFEEDDDWLQATIKFSPGKVCNSKVSKDEFNNK